MRGDDLFVFRKRATEVVIQLTSSGDDDEDVMAEDIPELSSGEYTPTSKHLFAKQSPPLDVLFATEPLTYLPP